MAKPELNKLSAQEPPHQTVYKQRAVSAVSEASLMHKQPQQLEVELLSSPGEKTLAAQLSLRCREGSYMRPHFRNWASWGSAKTNAKTLPNAGSSPIS